MWTCLTACQRATADCRLSKMLLCGRGWGKQVDGSGNLPVDVSREETSNCLQEKIFHFDVWKQSEREKPFAC